jgi:hypothetical protein
MASFFRDAGRKTGSHFPWHRFAYHPVRIHSGQVGSSLCTLGPKSRMTRQWLREPLIGLAAKVSERLGATLEAGKRRDVA